MRAEPWIGADGNPLRPLRQAGNSAGLAATTPVPRPRSVAVMFQMFKRAPLNVSRQADAGANAGTADRLAVITWRTALFSMPLPLPSLFSQDRRAEMVRKRCSPINASTLVAIKLSANGVRFSAVHSAGAFSIDRGRHRARRSSLSGLLSKTVRSSPSSGRSVGGARRQQSTDVLSRSLIASSAQNRGWTRAHRNK